MRAVLAEPFVRKPVVATQDLQAWADALPHPEVVTEASGRGTVETYTVAHGHDGGPERAW